MTQRFAMPRCDSWQVPGGTLLYSRHNGAKTVVTSEVATVVRHCDSFLTLEEHVQRLTELFPTLREQPEGVMQVLESLRGAGLLVPAEALCEERPESVPEAASERAPGSGLPSRPALCITTCDRPELVGRLFESMLRQVRLSRFSCVYLIDDSRDPSARQRNAEAVAEFSVVSPTPAVYIGPEAQDSLIEALVDALPAEREALECLLGRDHWGALPTYGRARNLALLLTVGERCLVLDDDILCQAWRSPQGGDGVAFGGEREVEFYSGSGVPQRLAPLDGDPLQALTSCLGLTLDEALDRLGEGGLKPELLAGVPALYLGRLGRDSRVLVTQCGTLGDPGTENNSWLAHIGPASVQRLLDVPGGLSAGFATRQVWLGYPVPTFSAMANMSQATGLDNRALLPPYLSGLRGEDRLFGTLTAALHPRSLTLDHDWAITHRPLPERTGNPEGDLGVPRGGLSLLDTWVEGLALGDGSASAETRLAQLAGHVSALGELSEAELRQLVGRLLTETQVTRLHLLDEQLRATGEASPAWGAWLNRNRQAILEALQAPPSLTTLPAVPEGMGEAEVAAVLRATASRYAAILRHWPAIRAAAAQASAALRPI